MTTLALSFTTSSLRLLSLALGLAVLGCGGGDGTPVAGAGGQGGASGGAGGQGGAGVGGGMGGSLPEPEQHVPCDDGDCWAAPSLAPLCGSSSLEEDFSSGLYNVHEYPLEVPGGVPLELSLTRTAGSWSPALIVSDQLGEVLYDGEVGSPSSSPKVQPITTGRDGDVAAVDITGQDDAPLFVYATGWDVVDSAFASPMPQDAVYRLDLFADCPPPMPGQLLSPPNFDPNDVQDGFYLLPESDPAGLYTRKADDCSRGTKLLIDVIYTVAWHWKQIHPELAPIQIRDLNEGSCSTVDHATHDDGTHVDLVAGCATEVACQDNQPAIDLAKLFVDTGAACGILNNDVDVQSTVNAYFTSQHSYAPWNGQFMRSVSGHTHHFHVRVKKPDGMCN